MSEELERVAKFYEGSWVGQFRAVDEQGARYFMQTVADAMQEMGVSDVGWSVREGSSREFSDDEARTQIVEHAPQGVIHDSVSHEEVRRQLGEARRRAEGGDQDN